MKKNQVAENIIISVHLFMQISLAIADRLIHDCFPRVNAQLRYTYSFAASLTDELFSSNIYALANSPDPLPTGLRTPSHCACSS